VISGFRREIFESWTLLGYYAESSDNFLPTFRDNLSVPYLGFKKKYLKFEDGTDRFFPKRR